MPNYVSLTESQRRKIAVFITESQQIAQQTHQLQQQQLYQQQQQQLAANGEEKLPPLIPSLVPNAISCKEIVQFCQTRFGFSISLSTASRLRSTATERLSTDLLNPSAKRHRSVKFPEFEKALVQELRSLELEQQQIQIEQDRINRENGHITANMLASTEQVPPVMMLTSEAAITQVAKGIAERMGITESELGLTSGWYHGFRKRHGIKHRQAKSRSNNNTNNSKNTAASSSMGAVTPITTAGDVTSSPGIGVGNSNAANGGDGSEAGDGDEEMEDVTQQTAAGSKPTEVKRVTAASGNDALDVISEYLLQNGEVGATKLPLVKELRRFLLMRTELENNSNNNNSSSSSNNNSNNNNNNVNNNNNNKSGSNNSKSSNNTNNNNSASTDTTDSSSTSSTDLPTSTSTTTTTTTTTTATSTTSSIDTIASATILSQGIAAIQPMDVRDNVHNQLLFSSLPMLTSVPNTDGR
ncbi:hypothetical protein BG004_006650 [Podila humilis]|nr:hypothetical protein BG004_006650 [Podila humilis]